MMVRQLKLGLKETERERKERKKSLMSFTLWFIEIVATLSILFRSAYLLGKNSVVGTVDKPPISLYFGVILPAFFIIILVVFLGPFFKEKQPPKLKFE